MNLDLQFTDSTASFDGAYTESGAFDVNFTADNISDAKFGSDTPMTMGFESVVNTGGDIIMGGGVGEDVSGTIQRPFDPNEAGGFEYIYEEPQVALDGAEIFNSYHGDVDAINRKYIKVEMINNNGYYTIDFEALDNACKYKNNTLNSKEVE